MAMAAAKQRIQELFEKFDTSRDGTLQLDEMAEVFDALILGGIALGWLGWLGWNEREPRMAWEKWLGCKAGLGNLGRAVC